MKIGKFVQSASDNLQYTLDYSNWLAAGETITAVSFAVDTVTTPALAIANTAIVGGSKVTFFTSGGVTGTTYDATVTVTTSAGQTKQCELVIVVRDGNFASGVVSVVTSQVRAMTVPVANVALVVS